MHVVVIGAGWAGLSTAAELCHQGIAVTVFESAPAIGGRARSVRLGELTVDNGQHLLLGAYHETLELLERCDADIPQLLLRLPLTLHYRRPAGEPFILKAPSLPAPLHLLWALLGAHGLSIPERIASLRLAFSMALGRFRIDRDVAVLDWLRNHGQPARVIEAVWEPLCLAALNTPLQTASTRVFLNVLKQAFARRRRDSDLLIPAQDLGQVFPIPTARFIESHGGNIRTGTRVSRLVLQNGKVTGVDIDGQAVTAEHVVIATSINGASRLLDDTGGDNATCAQLRNFAFQPICTVYLQYPAHVALDKPLYGLLGTCAQWVFDRAITGQAGLMAVVISGPGPHMQMDKQQLGDLVTSELASMFPDWPAPGGIHVIREKRATFSCDAGIEEQRPGNRTGVKGLWLAGDYTRTGLPATLEGAVISGRHCARQIIATHKS